MKFKLEILEANFSHEKLQKGKTYDCDLKFKSPFHLFLENDEYRLDNKELFFSDDALFLEGIIGNNEKILGRLLVKLWINY